MDTDVNRLSATVKDIVLAVGWPALRGSVAVARDQDWSEDVRHADRRRKTR